MARPQPAAGVAVEVLVEQDEVPPVRVVREAPLRPLAGRVAAGVGRKSRASRSPISCATSARFSNRPDPVGHSTWRSSP